MAAMGRSGTKKLVLKQNNFELILEREEHFSGQPLLPLASLEGMERPEIIQSQNRVDQALARSSEMTSGRLASQEPEAPKEGARYINSPMVGTFYSSPSPEHPPFVKVGDKIDKNTVVCIIEAMKVMNEIKANVSGTIAEVLVDGGQPVEFGTKLFRVVES